jgi:hypothetical protein
VLGTLAVLGTGLALIAVGPDAGRTPFLVVLGFGVSALTLHQGTFIVWAVVTGLHVLARLVPAVRIVTVGSDAGPSVPGRVGRGVVLALTIVVAAVAAVVLYKLSGAWLTDMSHHFGHHRPPGALGAITLGR